MTRLLFLLLAVVGAFAVIFAVVLGVGVVQMARNNAPIVPVARSKAQTNPADASADSDHKTPAASAAVAAVKPNDAAPAVALVPVIAPARDVKHDAVPAKLADNADPNGATSKVVGLKLIAADGMKPLLPLAEGARFDVSSFGKGDVSIAAEVNGKVGSVRFKIDAGDAHVERAPPFTIAGDDTKRANTWKASPGDHTLTVTPFASANADGAAGTAMTVHFTVLHPGEKAPPDVARQTTGEPIVAAADKATLHGQEMRVETRNVVPNIGYWYMRDESVDWDLNVDRPGLYRVDLLYACDPGNGGGEYELTVGDHRFTGTATPTGSWDVYTTRSAGELTLAAGKHHIVVKPLALDPGKSLLNLREVRFVPVK